MKTKQKTVRADNARAQGRVPKLRFSEFRDSEEWEEKTLGNVAELIDERAGSKKYTLMSVTAGIGLVSQIEKFGREIAGKQYKNYYVIKKGDFAYNKSATKQYPEGFISMLEDQIEAAVPNSIFTCFRVINKNTYSYFLKHMFYANFHGVWLRKFITVGGRAHGSLNIDPGDLFKMPIKLPSPPEQQKIADCLSSFDELITTQTQKLGTLKAHKKGLMQHLFPAEGETVPKLRFPKFCDAPEWEEKPLGKVYSFKVTNSFSRDKLNYEQGLVKNIHYGDIHTKFSTLFDIKKEIVPFINSSEAIGRIKSDRYCIEGDMVFADASEDLNDVGKSIEIVNLNNEKLLSGLHTLLARQKKSKLIIGFGGYLFKSDGIRVGIKKEAQGAKVLGVSAGRLSNINIYFPTDKKEQQKIVDCLSSIDELITAQAQKLDTLKTHKKGLMQLLFPSTDEVDG
jgi:type I restriction enzyme, S subunit